MNTPVIASLTRTTPVIASLTRTTPVIAGLTRNPMKILLLSLVITIAATVSLQAQPLRTESFSERVQTLRVFPEHQWKLAPIIDFNQNRAIAISFDVLGVETGHYTYKIWHCNADWTRSKLDEHEYLNGLQNNPLTDYDNSLNTTMEYVHYELRIPNERVRLKLSGNYAVQVFEDGNERPMLNACFSVVEPLANVQISVSPVTDKGANTHFQAVDFVVSYGSAVQNPNTDLKVYVLQNHRYDNAAQLVKPRLVQTGKAEYSHNPALIFDAGNEYRRFEMTTAQFPGLNIAAIEYHEPYYHTILRPYKFRSNEPYSYSEDLNGKVYIRNTEADNSDYEADYHLVHFSLAGQPLNEKVYILSEAFNNIFDYRSEMTYERNSYVKTALLKEGYYNYLYVTQNKPNTPAKTAPIEGDFYQTKNEYRVMVYARTFGKRYDQLIGVQTIN
ncbi:hypothetical protein AGMMS49982_21560 [Bacteroidia bacterium]|nr:hypothetical protein AGMMS49982_21560 [Bacteroidia bacterium]